MLARCLHTLTYYGTMIHSWTVRQLEESTMTQFIYTRSPDPAERYQGYHLLAYGCPVESLRKVCKWKRIDWSEMLHEVYSNLGIEQEHTSEVAETYGNYSRFDDSSHVELDGKRYETSGTESIDELMEELLEYESPSVLEELRAVIYATLCDRD